MYILRCGATYWAKLVQNYPFRDRSERSSPIYLEIDLESASGLLESLDKS